MVQHLPQIPPWACPCLQLRWSLIEKVIVALKEPPSLRLNTLSKIELKDGLILYRQYGYEIFPKTFQPVEIVSRQQIFQRDGSWRFCSARYHSQWYLHWRKINIPEISDDVGILLEERWVTDKVDFLRPAESQEEVYALPAKCVEEHIRGLPPEDIKKLLTYSKLFFSVNQILNIRTLSGVFSLTVDFYRELSIVARAWLIAIHLRHRLSRRQASSLTETYFTLIRHNVKSWKLIEVYENAIRESYLPVTQPRTWRRIMRGRGFCCRRFSPRKICAARNPCRARLERNLSRLSEQSL